MIRKLAALNAVPPLDGTSDDVFGQTQADGTFVFGALSPGTYDIVVGPPQRFDRRGDA